MNKIIFTTDRLFMSVVGPSGSGKTQLIFSMLATKTFYPRFQKIYFFYREIQPVFKEVERKLNIEFIPCLDFNLIKTLNDCLLIFDDSCEEIYQEKDFVKIAVSGRHRGVHCILVKHNLFHQSKWSRTIDLQSTHIILFNSPRDSQQIDYLGRQLKNTSFLRECYRRAISEQYGHLLIDLDPKTSECLRYCSNIVGPGPTIFYLPATKAKVTQIENGREKIGYTQALGKTFFATTKAADKKLPFNFSEISL